MINICAVSQRMHFRVKDLLRMISITGELVISHRKESPGYVAELVIYFRGSTRIIKYGFIPSFPLPHPLSLQADNISLVSCSQDGCSGSHHHMQTHQHHPYRNHCFFWVSALVRTFSPANVPSKVIGQNGVKCRVGFLGLL